MMRGGYWWWDDAVATANALARSTGRRFRVHRAFTWSAGLVWAVSEVDA